MMYSAYFLFQFLPMPDPGKTLYDTSLVLRSPCCSGRITGRMLWYDSEGKTRQRVHSTNDLGLSGRDAANLIFACFDQFSVEVRDYEAVEQPVVLKISDVAAWLRRHFYLPQAMNYLQQLEHGLTQLGENARRSAGPTITGA